MPEDVKLDAQDANSDATSTPQVDMVPNLLGLNPARFNYDSMDVVLSAKHFVWLRLTPMVMPVGVKVALTFPDGSRMDFEG